MPANFSFPKNVRLNKASDFKNSFRNGKKINNRYFVFYITPNNLISARLGIIVAKKNVRMASERNLIKRVIRESFRMQQEFIAGRDILVVVYHPVSTLDKTKLRNLLDQQWKKLSLSHEKSSLL